MKKAREHYMMLTGLFCFLYLADNVIISLQFYDIIFDKKIEIKRKEDKVVDGCHKETKKRLKVGKG